MTGKRKIVTLPKPRRQKEYEALHAGPSLLCKLGSIAVHAQEMLGPGGHDFDQIALRHLVEDDDEVVRWLAAMQQLALVPLKRNAPR